MGKGRRSSKFNPLLDLCSIPESKEVEEFHDRGSRARPQQPPGYLIDVDLNLRSLKDVKKETCLESGKEIRRNHSDSKFSLSKLLQTLMCCYPFPPSQLALTSPPQRVEFELEELPSVDAPAFEAAA